MEEHKVLLDKRKKYRPSLPCPKDKTSLLHHCIKNAVLFVEGAEGHPEKAWNADLYKCPSCDNLVLTDFGNIPEWTLENTPDLQGFLDERKKHGAAGGDPPVIVYLWQFEGRVAA